jgi:hypothetical protein
VAYKDGQLLCVEVHVVAHTLACPRIGQPAALVLISHDAMCRASRPSSAMRRSTSSPNTCSHSSRRSTSPS